MDSCAIGLLALDTLNVDNVLFPVYLDHLADLLSLVVSPHNLDRDGSSKKHTVPYFKTPCNYPVSGNTISDPSRNPELLGLQSRPCCLYTRTTKTSVTGQFQQLLKWKMQWIWTTLSLISPALKPNEGNRYLLNQKSNGQLQHLSS